MRDNGAEWHSRNEVLADYHFNDAPRSASIIKVW